MGPIIVLVGDEAREYIHRAQELRAVRVRVEGMAGNSKKLASALQIIVSETNPAKPAK